MPLTAQIGTVNSKPGNVEPGRNAAIPAFATTTPPTLVVEVAFAADPVTTAGYYYNDLNDGPTSYWRMDSQTSLVDQTGAGNTMTVVGTPTLTTSLVAGDTNQATIFNGTSQSASAPSTAGLSPTGPMSIELPLKTPSSMPGSTSAVAIKRGSFSLSLTSTGRLVFSVKKGTLVTSVTSNTVLATSTVYYVACVYDGAKLLLYLNGALDSSISYSAGIDATLSSFLLARSDNSSASPAYRSSAFASDVSAGIIINKPAGTVDGDYLLLFVQANLPQQVTTPTGWTLLGTSPASTTTLYAFGKLASGEPANYTVNADASTALIAEIAAFTGVGTIPYGSVSSPAQVFSTAITGSILPAYDNSLVVSCFSSYSSTSVTSWSESVGTERLDYGPSIFASMVLNTNAVASAAVTNNVGTLSTTGVLQNVTVELVGVLTSTYTAVTLDEVSLFGFGLGAAQVLRHYQQAITTPPTTTWTDISSDVRSVQITRGRQYELNKIEAGTASIVLNDDLRKYDPANSSGAYAPNVIPMRQIRARALLNSVYYPLFQGYIERWESVWSTAFGGSHAECTVTAVDGFEPLSLATANGNIQSSLSGTTIANLLGKANWPSAARSLDTGAFTVAAMTLTGNSVLDSIQQITDGEAGVFFINASGTAVFHDKNHRSTNSSSVTSQGVFGDQTLLALPYTALAPSKDKDHIVNDWTVTDSNGDDHLASDTTSQTKYFRRASSRSTFLSATDAATMSNYLLSVTANPGYRFDLIELTPDRNQPLWLQALQREISDRVTIQRQPVGITPGTQIVQDCWIERVQWTITPQGPWRVVWQLSPAG